MNMAMAGLGRANGFVSIGPSEYRHGRERAVQSSMTQAMRPCHSERSEESLCKRSRILRRSLCMLHQTPQGAREHECVFR